MIHSSGNRGKVYDLYLNQEEQNLLSSNAYIAQRLEKKMRFALQSNDNTMIRIEQDTLYELAGAITVEANLCRDKQLKKRWNELFAKIRQVFDENYTEERTLLQEEQAYQELRRLFPPETAQSIIDLAQSGECENLDELNQRMGDIFNEYNRNPLAELGGLSPYQLQQLIYADWDSPDGPIRFNADLPVDDLRDAPLLQDARILLSAIHEEGGSVKATASGNLNRQFVAKMLDRLDLPPKYLHDLHEYHKVVNERDVFPLHIPRLLLGYSGMIRKNKSLFTITQKGKKYLADDQAGKLYFMLFKAHFREFNIAYRDCLAANDPLQDTIAYSFWRIPQEAKDWIDTDELAPKIVLPIVREHAPVYEFFDHFHGQISSRIFYALKDFGLIERREIPTEEKYIFKYDVRTTPLYGKFIHFHFD